MKNRTSKQQLLTAFAVGLLFALGLGISGMTQPSRVKGFLDFFGEWDPTLMFVMMGAVSVHLLTYRLIKRRPSPLFDTKFHIPSRRDIDKPLVVGSLIFGVGWGIGGFCPGPALTSLGSGQYLPWVFVVSMFIGMLSYRALNYSWRFARYTTSSSAQSHTRGEIHGS